MIKVAEDLESELQTHEGMLAMLEFCKGLIRGMEAQND